MSGIVQSITSLFTGPPKPPEIEVPEPPNPAPPPPNVTPPPAATPRVDESQAAAQNARSEEQARARRARNSRGSSGIASSPLGTQGGIGAQLTSPRLGR